MEQLKLDFDAVQTVCTYVTGKRQEKLLASVQAINESLAAGGWLPGVSRSASSGFYQGLCRFEDDVVRGNYRHAGPPAAFASTLRFGSAYSWGLTREIVVELLQHPQIDDAFRKRGSDPSKPVKRPSDEVILAWCDLSNAAHRAITYLNKLRPLPVYTAIGLSPKVTATLTECNLDLDLPSIRRAKIVAEHVYKFNEDGTPKLDRFGEHDYDIFYRVEWSEGIVHNQSRFAYGTSRHGQCHACGKAIPSGRFVPIEAHDKRKDRLVSMWIGCDCARNIFGIKDAGVAQTT